MDAAWSAAWTLLSRSLNWEKRREQEPCSTPSLHELGSDQQMDNTPLHSISSVCHPWGYLLLLLLLLRLERQRSTRG